MITIVTTYLCVQIYFKRQQQYKNYFEMYYLIFIILKWVCIVYLLIIIINCDYMLHDLLFINYINNSKEKYGIAAIKLMTHWRQTFRDNNYH